MPNRSLRIALSHWRAVRMRSLSSTRVLIVLWGSLLMFAGSITDAADPPELLSLFPLGGCSGTTVELTVTPGAGVAPRGMLFSHPGIVAKHTGENRFLVEIGQDVIPADYDAWLIAASGLTNPRRFTVGARPELMELEGSQRNDKRQTAQSVSLPVVVNGLIDPPTDRDCFRFSIGEKQRFSIRCVSTSLEATVAPALTLIDPAGREVLHDTGKNAEPVLDYRSPQSGEYVVQVEDRAYRKGSQAAYRLELFFEGRLVSSFPNVLTRNQPQSMLLYGTSLRDGAPADVPFAGELQQVRTTIEAPAVGPPDGGGFTLTSSAHLDGFTFRMPGLAGGLRLGLVDRDITLEQVPLHATRETAQAVAIPCEVAGRFLRPAEVDWYRFSAKGGQVLWLEAVGERGSDDSMDLELTMHDASGKTLETFSDTAHAKEYPPECPLDTLDPSGTWKVPADGEYFLAIRDLYGTIANGVAAGYRISISPRHEAAAVVALPLNADKPGGLTIASGQSAEWLLVAVRRGGQQAPIRIRAEQLPPGLELKPFLIETNQFTARMTFSAAPDAAEWAGRLTLIAETDVDGKPLSFPVRGATYLREIKPPRARFTDGVAAAVIRN